jgi:hypothetical protein
MVACFVSDRVTPIRAPVHFNPLSPQLFLTFAPVWKDPSQYLPELGGVVAFMEMDKFMGDDIIHQPNRQMEETPMEMQHAILSARTPPETEVADGYLRGSNACFGRPKLDASIQHRFSQRVNSSVFVSNFSQ